MDHVDPVKLIENCVEVGRKKSNLGTKDMLIRGFLSGAFLAFATAFAFKISVGMTGGMASIVSGAFFPVGFVLITLLGFELVTGNFALLPMSIMGKKIGTASLLRNWGWVFLANLAGSVFFAALLVITLSQSPGDPLQEKILAAAQAKTLGYERAGLAGWIVAFVKGVLCNWMVTIGALMGLVSSSTTGKIFAAWLPIMTFFALGFEHSVVNMFIIPAGMMLGAPVGVYDWWIWNQVPVTLGNLAGGALFTGVLLFLSYGQTGMEAERQ